MALTCVGAWAAQTPPTAGATAEPAAPVNKQMTVEMIGADRASFDFRGVSLLEVLRLISDKTGMQFVVSGELADVPVAVYLKNVPVEEGLRAILSANRLYMDKPANTGVYIIKSLEKSPPLHVAVINVKNVEAKQLEEVVKSNLTPKGQVVVDRHGNSLIVRDSEEIVTVIREVIKSLDKPSPQVLIRSHIVEVETTAERKLGIDWGAAIGVTGAAQAITAPFGSKRPWIYNQPRPGEGDAETALEPAFTYGKVDFTGLSATLRFLESQGVAKVLASPSVAARNDQEASIKILTHLALAVQTVFNDAGNVVQRVPIYGDVGITLNTKPWVNADGKVTLMVEPSVSSASKDINFADAVDTKTRTAKTEVTLNDGDVIAIGGLLRTDVTRATNKLPFLGDIPYAGRLFRYDNDKVVDSDLVIFVSPMVMKDNDKKMTDTEVELVRNFDPKDKSQAAVKARGEERPLFQLPGLGE